MFPVNRSFALSINIFLAYLFCALYLLLGNMSFLILYFILGGVNFLLLYSEKFTLKWVVFFLSLSGLFIFEFIFFSSYPKQNAYLLSLLFFISSLGFALNLVYNLNRVFVSKVLLIIYLVFLSFVFFKYGIFLADGLNTVFFNSSRNIVSAVLILLFINYLLCCYFDGVKTSPYFYFVVFLFSVFLYGRSGIIFSFFLLLYYLFFLNRFIFSIVLIFGTMFFLLYNYNVNALWEATSFSQGLESARTDMRREYFSGILANIKFILLGQNYYDCCYTIVAHDLNAHNSFISGHAKFGIIHTLLVLILIFWIFLSRNFYIIFLFLLIMIRYFYDELGLFNLYDTTLYLLVVISFLMRRKQRV